LLPHATLLEICSWCYRPKSHLWKHTGASHALMLHISLSSLSDTSLLLFYVIVILLT
jgi:hypothetical protein